MRLNKKLFQKAKPEEDIEKKWGFKGLVVQVAPYGEEIYKAEIYEGTHRVDYKHFENRRRAKIWVKGRLQLITLQKEFQSEEHIVFAREI